MVSRPRPKRPRHTFVASRLRAPPAWRDILSVELWHEVFSHCLPLTLLVVRNTCRLFRDIVERHNGVLLARAPLLLPYRPPDPRRLMRYTHDPDKYQAMSERFDINNPWPSRGTFGSATYTKLLFLPGRCYVCQGRAEGPPTWTTHMIYICSRRCRVEMFRTKVVYLIPKKGNLPRPTFPMDRHIVPSLTNLVMTKAWSKARKKFAVLRSDLKKARREYRRRVIAPLTAEERKRGQVALFAEYRARRHRARALMLMDDYIDLWRGKMDHAFKQTLKRNKALYVFLFPNIDFWLIEDRLRKFATSRSIPFSEAFGNSKVQSILLACSREFGRITPSILSDAGLISRGSKDEKCAHCGAWVSRGRLDYHIANSHPTELRQERINPTTGKAEYRCGVCEKPSLRWFSAQALREHQYDRHSVREEEEEGRPSETGL
ncbi:hypothetical protein K523DRAFT_376091 [Schizophyllum commune Tattone D]|nr:hypothetical protein K523DRAFT_376091 [Schizophyllum commune Tattone D]